MNIPRTFKIGIRLPSNTSYTLATEGDFKNTSGILQAYLGGSARDLITNNQTQTLTNKTIDADANTITNIENADIKAGAAIDATKIGDGAVNNTEFSYLDGVTSTIQTQIDGKVSSASLTAHTGASTGVHGVTGAVVGTTDTQTLTNKTIDADANTITNIENADIKAGAAIAVNKLAALTASCAVQTDGSGFVSASTVTSTELGYVSGVTSAIQTQLSGKVTGPGSSVDNTVARFDGISGGIVQGSGVVISDTNAVSAITQLDVDNIRTDGNTISSTDANGNVTISPNGTGIVDVTKDLSISKTLRLIFATDSSTTGSAAVLGTPSTSAVRLTNGSLTSIGTIPAGVGGQVLYLENAIGASFTILNDTGGTAADRIYTGTGSTLTVENQATICLIYDTTTARWLVSGGTGSGAAPTPSTGSPDNIFLINADDYANTSTFSTGDGTIVAGSALPGGTLQGTFTRNTSTPATGTADWKYTQAAGSLDSYIFSDAKTIDPAFRGKDVGVNIIAKYDGADNDILWIVWDETNSQFLTTSDFYLKSSSTYKNYQTVFSIPSTCTQIRVGFQVKVLNSGKIVEWDMISVFDRPFVMKDTAEMEYAYYSGIVGTASTATSTAYATTLQTNTFSTLGSISNTSTNGWVFTSTCAGVAKVSWWSDNATGSLHYAGWGKNLVGTENIYNISTNSTNTVKAFAVTYMNAGGGTSFHCTAVIPIAVGDTLRPMVQSSGNVTGNANCGGVTITVQKPTASVMVPGITNGVSLIAKSDSQSVATATTTKVTWDTITSDPEGLFDNANDRWIAPRDGTIQVDVGLQWGPDASGSRTVYIRKNNVAVNAYVYSPGTAISGAVSRTTFKMTVLKGDYIEIFGRQTSGSTIAMGDSDPDQNIFQIHYLDAKPIAAVPADRVLYLKDVKATNTAGGTLSSGVNTRTLNTIEGDTSFSSFSSNQFTLIPGTYDIDFSAPNFATDQSKSYIYNTTDSAIVSTLIGNNSYSSNASAVSEVKSIGSGRVYITATKTFELRTYAQTTQSTNGAGRLTNDGNSEVYSIVKIKKIK